MPRSRRASATASATLAAVACLVAACGTREDDAVGAGFILDQGGLKAVRFLEIAPPDTSTDYQLAEAASDAGISTTIAMGRHAGLTSRAYLRFASDAFPDSGTTIDSAFVSFKLIDSFGEADSVSFAVRRITAEWGETDSALATAPPAMLAALDTVALPLGEAGDTARIVLPELFRFWTDEPDSNFGVVLDPLDDTAAMIEVQSNETIEAPVLAGWWSVGGADTSIALATTDDATAMTAGPDFVPLAGAPRRMTIARGFPARTLIDFVLPGRDSVPELWERSTVNRAELRLHVDEAASSFNRLRIGARRVYETPWSDDSTLVGELLFGLVDVVTDSTTVVLDVRELLENVFDETEADHGFELRALDERPDADYVRFHAHDSEDPAKWPSLRIWYTPGDGGSQ